MNFPYELIVIAVMLLFNAVFAAYEMALASVSQARLAQLASQKKRGAASALEMKERMEASLAVVQLGITLVGAIAAATGGAGVEESFAPWLEQTFQLSEQKSEVLALALFVIPLSAFTIVFGELIPKMFAIENNDRVCLWLSPAMRWISRVASPIVNVIEKTVKMFLRLGRKRMPQASPDSEPSELHDLHMAVSLARARFLLGLQEERIVMSAAQLSRRRIQEIILPASEISMIPSDLPLTEALIRAHLDLHTRFPICAKDGDPQTIEGYITFKDLVSALKMHATAPTVKGIARPIKRIRAGVSISEVLQQMIREKLHIALVESGEGHVLGLITLEDIIEELVGEIEDEADDLPGHLQPTSGGWILGGGVPMHAVASRLGVPWSSRFANPETLRLAEWCVQILGRAVKKGETLQSDGLQVHVRKTRRRKVAEAFVSKLPA